MTTAEIYNDFKNKLKTIYDDREADNVSDWVFENVTGLKKWERRENQNKEINETEFEKLKNYLEELLEHRPVQYILNEAWFYKMKFYVNEHVLIPRPETEELVEWVINDAKFERANNSKQTNIIDIGTGSGCIPVSLKKELPESNVTAIDLSEKALLVAKKNAVQLDAAVDFFQIDFLKKEEWETLSEYDIIVSNPPYIPINEKEILAKNVTDFEPEIALFVDDNDPFIFYKNIPKFAKSHLKENGKIYVEVHEEYAREVKNLFENAGFISEIKKDIYGKERMVKALKSKTIF
jgi:release factor glutamine methyltransferase